MYRGWLYIAGATLHSLGYMYTLLFFKYLLKSASMVHQTASFLGSELVGSWSPFQTQVLVLDFTSLYCVREREKKREIFFFFIIQYLYTFSVRGFRIYVHSVLGNSRGFKIYVCSVLGNSRGLKIYVCSVLGNSRFMSVRF